MNKTRDSEITGEIIAALAASPDINATDILVSTHDGRVHLTGTARTLEESAEAEKIASRIARGPVENNIVLSANRDVSDREMTDALNADLAASQDLIGIGGRVTAGTAFLMGKVRSVAVENRAVEVASGIAGVRQVISDLQIAAGEPVDNITLANDVAEAISEDPDINVIDMDVAADDGMVTVTGEVETQREFDLIRERAAAVPGVQHVQDLVTVRGWIYSTPSRRPSSSGTQYQPRPLEERTNSEGP